MKAMRLVSLGGALLLAACSGDRAPRVEVGAPAPAYATRDLGGAEVSLAALRGEVVLLNVWATWCVPCRTEIPALEAIHRRFQDRGLRVVGVSVDARGEQESIREFADSYGVTFDLWHDPEERVAATFRAIGVPSTYLIDRDGTLLWKHVGPVSADDPSLLDRIEAGLGSSS